MANRAPGGLELGHEIHAVDIQGDIVVLDLTREAYLCLPADAGANTGAEGDGTRGDGLPADATSLLSRLNAAGIPVSAASRHSPYTPPPLPRADLGAASGCGLSARDALDAAQATLRVFRAYRGRGVGRLIADVHARAGDSRESAPAAQALARRFNRWVVLAATPDKCLVRSFMLMDYLRRHGVSGTWVFGVRTWPFRAHCWVQHEGVALDEHWERLIPYTPLLAVRG